LIEVAYTGICGTDLHEYMHGPTFSQPPVILGHETAGVVVACGEGVPPDREGERVVVIPMDFCGECHYCMGAQYHLCDRPDWIGFTRAGAFAKYLTVPSRLAIRVPDSVPLDVAALTEHFTVTYHAVRRSQLQIGESVLVLGAGPVGLAAVQCATTAGAGHVIVSEPSAARREQAMHMGATDVLDPTDDVDIPALVRKLTHGIGADVIFDCAGQQAGVDHGFSALRKGGRFVSMSSWEGPAHIDMNQALLNEHEIIFVFGYDMFADFPAVLDLMARGVLDAGQQISGRISLEHVIDQGFERLSLDRGDVVKLLVKF